MQKNTVILSLSSIEQEALALCGIKHDEQLARITPQALYRELQEASAFFSHGAERLPNLNRVYEICRLSGANSAQPLPARTSEPVPAQSDADYSLAQPQKRRCSAATGRMLVAHEARQAKALDATHKKEDPRDFSHAIHCAHPFATYLAAWATVFLAIAGLTLLLSVAGLLIGIVYIGPAGLIFVAVLIVVVLNYAIMMNMANCSTCRISIFSFRRYARNRKAHHFPLLGYTIPTALSVIFCLRYRCPSCGTPQKLFGRRHRRGSSKKR